MKIKKCTKPAWLIEAAETWYKNLPAGQKTYLNEHYRLGKDKNKLAAWYENHVTEKSQNSQKSEQSQNFQIGN